LITPTRRSKLDRKGIQGGNMLPLLSRRHLLSAGAATLAGASLARLAPVLAAPIGPLEKPKLTLGLAVDGSNFAAVYIAAARLWKEMGLNIEMTSFRGDAEVAQALAGDSVDISLQSYQGLVNLISANQPVIGFYAGFWQADFAWLAQPAIKGWADLKGQAVGVSTFGSLTDQLTRYALKRHGLEPGKDVQIMQAGPSSSSYQALKSGRLTAAIQSAPYKWIGEDNGLTVLGTQVKDIGPTWPKNLFVAKQSFLDKNPNWVKAFLRAHVAGIRVARADRAFTVKVLMDRLKYAETYAARAYDELIEGYDERGRFPDMKVFWDITVASGDVKEPWPNSKLLDDRFIKSFDEWAPA
jgi:NitT/TauT family transport system substrate-binding protein